MHQSPQTLNNPVNYVKPKPLFIVITGMVLILGYLSNQWMNYRYIYTDEVIMSHYEQMDLPTAVILDMVANIQVQRWRYYLLNAGLIATKILVITIALSVAFELANKSYSLTTNLWLVICSEYVSLIYSWYKFYGLVLASPLDLQQALTYAPLSVYTTATSGSSIWWYALGCCNLFQLAQIMVLAVLIHKYYPYKFPFNLKLSAQAYSCCWFIWIVLVTTALFYGQGVSE